MFEDVTPHELIHMFDVEGFIESFEDYLDGTTLDPWGLANEANVSGLPVASEDNWTIYRMIDGAVVINMKAKGLDLWKVVETYADYIRFI